VGRWAVAGAGAGAAARERAGAAAARGAAGAAPGAGVPGVGPPAGPPGGSVGSLIVGAADGLGGRLIRTVSFLGWTLPLSFLGGTAPVGMLGIFSAIINLFCCKLGFPAGWCQTHNCSRGTASRLSLGLAFFALADIRCKLFTQKSRHERAGSSKSQLGAHPPDRA
jgi:hypothetical protein